MAGATNPRINIQLLPADIVQAFEERKDLLVGQIETIQSHAVSGQLYTNVQNLTDDEIDYLFSPWSELTQRIDQYLKATNRIVRLDVIPIADPGGGSASGGTIEFSGTVDNDGIITLDFIDEYQFTATFNISSTDTIVDIAEAVSIAINAFDRCPAYAIYAPGSATVGLASRNIGPIGGKYGVKLTSTISGLTINLTAFSAGSGIPTLTGIFDVIGDNDRYTGIGWPEGWSGSTEIAELINFLEPRFNADNAIIDGVGFVGYTDTYANSKAYVEALNSKVLVVGGNNYVNKPLYKGPAILKPADYTMSYFMGIRAKRLTTGASIANDIVATSGRLDNIGGPALASLPYFNTQDKLAIAGDPADLFKREDQIELAEAGFTVVTSNKGLVNMGEVVTTYKTDTAGNANISFHYLNYVDTGSVCREILFNAAKARFSQTRLTTGTVEPGRNIADAGTIKAHYLAIYDLLAGLTLVQKGTQAVSFVSQNTTVTIDLSNRTATLDGPLPIVTQLGVINYLLQFNFSLETGQQVTV